MGLKALHFLAQGGKLVLTFFHLFLVFELVSSPQLGDLDACVFHRFAHFVSCVFRGRGKGCRVTGLGDRLRSFAADSSDLSLSTASAKRIVTDCITSSREPVMIGSSTRRSAGTNASGTALHASITLSKKFFCHPSVWFFSVTQAARAPGARIDLDVLRMAGGLEELSLSC